MENLVKPIKKFTKKTRDWRYLRERERGTREKGVGGKGAQGGGNLVNFCMLGCILMLAPWIFLLIMLAHSVCWLMRAGG